MSIIIIIIAIILIVITYGEMLYAQHSISPWEWDTQTPLGF